MNGVRFKAGVLPIKPAPAGIRILGALDATARRLKRDLLVTCADKEHPPADPHSTGEAFDVRTHDVDDATKRLILRELMLELQNEGDMLDAPIATGIGLSTLYFYGQIEFPNDPREHLHIQLRRGVTYGG
jgi:hypothetical protein